MSTDWCPDEYWIPDCCCKIGEQSTWPSKVPLNCSLQFSSLDFTPAEFLKDKFSKDFHWNSKCILPLYPQTTKSSEVFVRFRSLGWVGELQNNKLNHLQKIPWAENSLWFGGVSPPSGCIWLLVHTHSSLSRTFGTRPAIPTPVNGIELQGSSWAQHVGTVWVSISRSGWVYGMTNSTKGKAGS